MPIPEPPLREKDFSLKVWSRWFQSVKSSLPTGGDVVTTVGVQTLTNKTLVSPIISNLTASRLVYGDAAKVLQSVANLASWIAGTANRITITDDGDGTITITIPDTPQLTGLLLSSLTASRLLASDGTKNLVTVADLAAWIAGTGNQITITNDGDGSITLSLPAPWRVPATGADYFSLATDGEVGLHGTARITKIHPADFGFSNAGAYRTGTIFTYLLDPTSDESIIFYTQIPYDFEAGSNVIIKFRWHPHVTNSDGVDRHVYWRGYYHAVGSSGLCVSGGDVTVNPFSATVPDGEVQGTIHEETWKTIAGLSAGDILHFEIYRDADNAGDDYADEVEVWRSAWIEYIANKLGQAT